MEESLNLRDRNLYFSKDTFYAKMSYAGFPGPSPAISMQFTWIQTLLKFTKNPFWGIQNCSRSSMLINLKSLSPVLVKICSMSVPICNHFQT